ncbi:MAG: sigma-54-dependent Fis family transcriptional regulator [Bacteroidales bacterium]|nr:sigma-54-dependent Fis family transcriptional regulator [Bacteroidales bacterium]
MEGLKTLILDDDRLYANHLKCLLTRLHISTTCALTPSEAFDYLLSHPYDLFICDIFLPEKNGLEILKLVKQKYPGMDVILISGKGDMDTVIKALRLGAVDYLKKPFSEHELLSALKRTQKFNEVYPANGNGFSNNSLLSNHLIEKIPSGFIGTSQGMVQVRNLAILASREKDVNILITGENGTGKEIVARIIHFASDRNNQPFYPVNSAAIPDSLLESEFFGHRKGSFTGANENKKGFFELADNGTLFLDEISEMPLQLQAKLLRAIEEKKIKPVGGINEINVDIRIVSATNSNVDELISKKRLRIDLYHRLNTMMINIPPLRERPEDIRPLVDHFAHQFSIHRFKKCPQINPNIIDHLKKYHFPGNVRELKNMVERAIIISRGKEINKTYFEFQNYPKKITSMKTTGNLNIDENEMKLIIFALFQSNNNNTVASRLLGISRDTLIRKKKKYNIGVINEKTFNESPFSKYLC